MLPKIRKEFCTFYMYRKNNFKITLKTKCNESEINKRFQKLTLLRQQRSLVGGKDNEINMWRSQSSKEKQVVDSENVVQYDTTQQSKSNIKKDNNNIIDNVDTSCNQLQQQYYHSSVTHALVSNCSQNAMQLSLHKY
uniref:Uncharacterized protein n=1 Tax=Glossina palpalis gambiensis TaxID=67801 RepID=A0A1B0BTL6_9MUSC